jgi:hypothetical protein
MNKRSNKKGRENRKGRNKQPEIKEANEAANLKRDKEMRELKN